MKGLYRILIRFYQKRISPHKGYRCAYSLEHGGPGCSGAVLSILESNGLIKGWSLIRRRFDQCTDAAEERRKRRERRKENSCDCLSSGCDSVDDLMSCAGRGGKGSKDLCDLPSCDLPGCDCGGISLVISLFFRIASAKK